ncbi:signal transduction histidine kinase [Kitasatospora gansuensis]|uniref:histidine kinase n=1 Tax=Kitasatospora gansuensis TaxID=258050 RepID=A0A7W7WFP3_9ACTN|nr:sensor histidine kinase [Kitasatospora gansuensis]MBB4945163.1 signal transduction histidine kinase [Kitasatospora gansuensis]
MKLKAGARRATVHLVGGLLTAVPALAGYVLLPLVLLTMFGLPVLPAAVRPLRRLADVERRRAGQVLGRPVPGDYPPVEGDLMYRSSRLIRDAGTWRDISWMLVHGLLGTVVGTLVLGLCLSVAVALTVPLWWWAAPPGAIDMLGVPVTDWPRAIGLTAAQILLCTGLLYALAPIGMRLQARLAAALLSTSRADAGRRIEELTVSRAEALEAHGAELRRIERDLHDGTQAQLVAVALRLGLADRVFEQDPDASRKLFLDARTGVEEALTQLRTVIRGIHPPILSDRGLNGAIRSLAAGRPIPVALDLPDLPRRPPAAVEAAAYFVVAEALTNIARHSGATRAEVSLRQAGRSLRITVRDDGRGGADPQAGSGLAGVRRRVAALDGTTRIDSPVGAGTTLEVVLPCGS